MRRGTLNLLSDLLSLIILAGVVYFFRNPLLGIYHDVEQRYFPCRNPIEYSVGTVDKRFGVKTGDFAAAVSQAADIWSKALGRPLFALAGAGTLKVNLLYDYRQAATQQLRQIDIGISKDRKGYDLLGSKYEQAKAAYDRLRADYKVASLGVEQRRNDLQAEISSWNSRGGAPADVFRQLDAQRAALNAEISRVNDLADQINQAAVAVNDLASQLNALGKTLNIKADQYNNVVDSRGQEFEEGSYHSDANGEAIDIYEFDTHLQLVRVLVHEFGHALGLEHSQDPKDVMYRLNQGSTEKLSPGDVAAAKKRCKIN